MRAYREVILPARVIIRASNSHVKAMLEMMEKQKEGKASDDDEDEEDGQEEENGEEEEDDDEGGD